MNHQFLCLILLLTLALAPTLSASGEPALASLSAVGQLNFVQAVCDGGLDGVSALALSPDEQFLYTVSYQDDAVSAYRRDPASGRLSCLQVIRDGSAGATELEGAVDIAVTPDGGHVYVASEDDDALTVFSRDATSGRLSFAAAYKDEVGGITSLGGAYSVVASPDSQHIYVAGRIDDLVNVFYRNPASGLLTFLEAEGAGLNAPYGLAISPNGENLYAASYSNDSIVNFDRDPISGLLTFLNSVTNGVGGVTGMNAPYHLTVSADGENVYAVALENNSVVAFGRDSVSGTLSFIEAEIDGVGGVDGLFGAIAVEVSPDGAHVYVSGQLEASVAVFSRNAVSGELTFLSLVRNGTGGLTKMAWPMGIVFNQAGDQIYVAAYASQAVVVFSRSLSSGALTLIEEQVSVSGLQGAVGVAVSAHGCVYATGYEADALTYFSRDPVSGRLTYRGSKLPAPDTYMDGPIGVAVSPDGDFVYVANLDNDELIAFAADENCSGLTVVINLWVWPSHDGIRSLAVSPDGSKLYAASELADSLTILTINPTTGQPSYNSHRTDGVDGVDGLDGAYSVAVSPDGQSVYVAGYQDDAVAIFHYSGATLNYVGMVKDGVGGVDGLDGANSVAVSPDGTNVYVAGRLDDALALFVRNPATGLLTYYGLLKDGVGGVDGLDGARALAVSPDGRQIYVASQVDHALAVFDRTATYSVVYNRAYMDDAGGVNGLGGADGLAVSPQGGHLYVAGYNDDALAVFSRFQIFLPIVIHPAQ